jgi:hypothetical protein
VRRLAGGVDEGQGPKLVRARAVEVRPAMMLSAEAQLSVVELALLGWLVFAALAVIVGLFLVSRSSR